MRQTTTCMHNRTGVAAIPKKKGKKKEKEKALYTVWYLCS